MKKADTLVEGRTMTSDRMRPLDDPLAALPYGYDWKLDEPRCYVTLMKRDRHGYLRPITRGGAAHIGFFVGFSADGVDEDDAKVMSQAYRDALDSVLTKKVR